MKLTLPLLSTMAATAAAWNCGPTYYGLVRPSVWTRSPARRLLENQRSMIDRAPRYEYTNDDTKFEVAVAVPGFEMKDIHVTVEDDGKMLKLTGKRESSSDNYSFTSEFSQAFSLESAVDTDKFEANLKNGVLIVGAPKVLERLEESVRRIPISEAPVVEDTDHEEVHEIEINEDETPEK